MKKVKTKKKGRKEMKGEKKQAEMLKKDKNTCIV